MVSFDDLIPQQNKNALQGKTFATLTKEDRAKIRAGNADVAQAAMEQGLQGATFNLADEAYNRIGALGAYGYQALSDMPTESQDPRVAGVNLGAVGRGINSLQELTDVASQDTSKRLAEQLQERPVLSIGSNIAGALLTGGAGATTKGGQAVANSLRSGNLAARAGKAGLLGAASGGLAGAGAGSGLEDRLESASNAGMVGGVAGGAIPVVGAVAGKVAKQFSKSPTYAGSEEIKQLANQAYKKADETGGVLKGWFTNRFLDDIADIKPASVAGKQVPTDPKLAEALEYVGSLKNQRLTLQDAQNLDEYLGDAIDGFTTLGQVNKSGQKLLEVQRKLRNSIENADDTLIEGGKQGFESLKEARKLWSAQLKMRDIERIIQKAENTQNPATSIKTGFNNLLLNAKKSKGYTKEELALIEKAAKGGPVQDILGTFGSRLWTIAGGASGGPLGAVGAQVGSMASRGMATSAALKKAEDAARAVSSRAMPPAQQGGLPALIGSKSAGQLALPAGSLATIPERQPSVAPANPVATPALDFNDLIPQMQNSGSLGQPMPPQSLKEKIGGAESNNNPNASNPNSTATGIYQFTDPTWKSAVDKWGRKYGIKYSDKNDPQKQSMLMDYLLQDNARILQNKGIEPSDANLYSAHFMGAPAASKAIQMLGKNAVAARSFPKAAEANPEIFFEGRRPRTIDEVYEIITSKVV